MVKKGIMGHVWLQLSWKVDLRDWERGGREGVLTQTSPESYVTAIYGLATGDIATYL